MSIVNEISRIKAAKEETIAALIKRGIEIEEGTKLDEFPQLIRSIGEEPEWTPHPDWWDLIDIANNDTTEGARLVSIVLLMDSESKTRLDRNMFGGDVFRTSDGYFYAPDWDNLEEDLYHTWDKSQDKTCSDGYKTRYIIAYSSEDGDIDFSCESHSVLCIVLGKVGFSSIHVDASMCQAILCLTSTTCTPECIFNISSDTLKVFEIPYGIETIGSSTFDNMFLDFSKLNLKLPDSVKYLEMSAFQATQLSSLILPEGLLSIGESCFEDCYKLKSIVFPSSLTSIGMSAFQATKLSSLILPEGLLSIGESCFEDCYKLKSIVFPSSLTSIGTNAFRYAEKLEKVVFNSAPTIGAAAFNSCGIKTIQFSELQTEIVQSQFSSCNFTNIIIPNHITIIGESAFENCESLKSVIIPASIEQFGQYVFDGSSNLESITFLGTDYPLLVLTNLFNLKVINVPINFNTAINIEDSGNLSLSALINLFENLKDLTSEDSKIIQIHETVFDQLTEAELNIAINKNWIIQFPSPGV